MDENEFTIPSITEKDKNVIISPFTTKPLWLVYQLGEQEQGSECWSSYWHYCIAEGEDKEEAILNWAKNIKVLYNVELYPKINRLGYWESYYPIVATKLPTNVFGETRPLEIIDRTKYYKE